MRLIRNIFLFFTLTIVASCGDRQEADRSARVANGNVYYGGVFRMNEAEDFTSLYPLDVTDVTSQRIASQVYEGLVKFSQSDLSVTPSIAEKWEKNDDATTWTFYIRKGVFFHDNPCFDDGEGREVKAKDIKYCFDKLCENSAQNKAFALTFKDKVVGANEYFESTRDGKGSIEGGVSGVKVLGDYTIEVSLLFSYPNILNVFADIGCSIYPQEAFDKYGVDMRVNCVGTGPFKTRSLKEGDHVILERNPHYWGIDEFGNQLPYLDAIKFSFMKEKKSEFLEFRKGNLDMVFQLPTEMIPEILGKNRQETKERKASFDIQITPAMSIFYFGFLHQSNVFDKKEVRQAFNYAIDREKIVNYTLQGEGIPALFGIVPPAFKKDYKYESVKGYNYNPERAKKLLAEAGYKNGNGFPRITLQTNSGGGDRNIQITEIIQKMLKENLNIDIDINVMPMPEHIQSFETGKSLFWRAGWLANYPDPEIFLNLLYGSHVPAKVENRAYMNPMRYISPKFDSLFYAAIREVDTRKRFELYALADQVAIDDAAIMPIFYEENYRLVKTNVKNFPINGMEFRDLTKVYFAPTKKDKQKLVE